MLWLKHSKQTHSTPPIEEGTRETEEQQPPYMEAEMYYSFTAISLVQEALAMMNEGFISRADKQEKEYTKLKETVVTLEEAVARLKAERDTGPTPPWVVIENTKKTIAKVNKQPRVLRRKGTAGQEEARREHRAYNARH